MAIPLNPDQKSRYGISAITRFLTHIKLSKDNTCWEWTSSKTPKGYGLIEFNGKMIYTHRFIYEYLHGPIPAELEIDHLCSNRACANPKHLEAVLHTENIRRGNSGIINRQKTHCPQGHEYSLANTYHNPNGGRDCRICINDRIKKYRMKLKLERI